MTRAEKKTEAALPDLPKHPVKGDIVAIHEDKRRKYAVACQLAGYDAFDASAHHEVLAAEPWQGTQRLRIAAQPFYLARVDVVIAESDDERRKRLRALGHRV